MSYLIIVTGTPGTGKSSVSSLLSELLGCGVTGDRDLLPATTEDPSRRETRLLAEERASALAREIVTRSRNCLIIDTIHPTLWFDDERTAVIVLLRAHPRTIIERLSSRGWSRQKIVENVLAEAFGEIAEELYYAGLADLTIEVDATNAAPAGVAAEIWRRLDEWSVGISIDWLAMPEVMDLVALLLREQDLH